MGDILVGKNEKRLLLVPRSGSHSLVVGWMLDYEPKSYALWNGQKTHPSQFLSIQEVSDPSMHYSQLGVLVRNPIERFRSMVAHRALEIEQQINNPIYGPIVKLRFTHFFRFEDQLQECADWLGITSPLPRLDSTEDAQKPMLTSEYEARVRKIYADDISLWESLRRK